MLCVFRVLEYSAHLLTIRSDCDLIYEIRVHFIELRNLQSSRQVRFVYLLVNKLYLDLKRTNALE